MLEEGVSGRNLSKAFPLTCLIPEHSNTFDRAATLGLTSCGLCGRAFRA
jgi:hypothetical protein